MITGVALNPCIDKTVNIDGFTFAGMNRILSSRIDGGGKGIHIALACEELGLGGYAIGFMYTNNKHLIVERLEGAKVPYSFVEAPGDIRTNLKLFDQKTSTITEINESGPVVTQAQMREMEALVDKMAPRSKYMVFTGSLPPGVPEDYYKKLMQIAGGRCGLVLDAEGSKLRHGLEAGPFHVKPNTYELELLCERKLSTLDDIRLGALHCIHMGARYVCISMGADGALLTDGSDSFYAERVDVPVLSTVGAGDCMVSGLLYGFEQGFSLEKVLACGAAAGTAAVMTKGTQLFQKQGFEDMLKRVRTQKL